MGVTPADQGGLESGSVFQSVNSFQVTNIKLLTTDTTKHLTFIRLTGTPALQPALAIRAGQFLIIGFLSGFVFHGFSLAPQSVASTGIPRIGKVIRTPRLTQRGRPAISP
jgi:hypothetical protein